MMMAVKAGIILVRLRLDLNSNLDTGDATFNRVSVKEASIH